MQLIGGAAAYALVRLLDPSAQVLAAEIANTDPITKEHLP
jgi:hypothetical protein